MRPVAITVSRLTKKFGEVSVIKDVSFQVRTGSITALLGGNGAGKTSILSMLLGLLTPTRGSIELLGHEMPSDRHLILARMNFCSPYVDLPKRLTVRQNLDVFARLYGIRNPSYRIERLANELALEDFIDRPTGKLSSGQGTRVALAKALINQPDILLLDEPTASLDPDTADWIRGYLRNFQKETGGTILLASHNMGEVEQLCDEVILLKSGTVSDAGSPFSLLKKYGYQTLEEVFLDIARSKEVSLNQSPEPE
ncbi:MAG: ABC transporter ATP-binding protein [Rhodospirillaceae bacterium]